MSASSSSSTPPITYTIRPAMESDVPTIFGFVKALAEFEELADQVSATEETLRASMFGTRQHAEALIAEVDGRPAGFALFFHNFSTFTGRPGLYLEDLYVAPEFRSAGIGSGFFKALAAIALERNCMRMEWWVLDWNERAIAFYRRLGAEAMSEWTVQRLDRTRIEELAAK